MKGRLRIIGGRWRGRTLQVADRPGLRPSGDRSREVLFNWLQGRTAGALGLDLFAGTGALGLEAASRGAARAVLVERDRRLAESLKRVRDDWPDADAVEVVRGDALSWLETATGPLDLVFVDPPFGDRLHARVLEALLRPGLLAADARVYVESPAREPAPVVEGDARWSLLRDKRVGEVRMQLLEPTARTGEAVPAPSV
ncbi:MAG: 16S rRNA (guanine(966)-N(2))-methyltransferase RsmD [Candidatus Wenzhouxiangella sp. M2_3B_020]